MLQPRVRRLTARIGFSPLALVLLLRTIPLMGFEGREKKEASYHGPQPVGASENATGKGGLTQLEHLIQCGGTHHPEAVADLLQQFPNEQARMVELLQSTRGNAFVQQVLRVAALREGLRATDGRSDHGRASIPLDHQRSHFARATNAGYSAAPFSFATDPLDISDIDAEHSAGSSAQIIAALHGRIGRWEPQLSILMEQAKAPGDDASRQAMMAEFAQLLEAAEQVRQDLQVLEADAIKDMALAKSFANDAQADAKRARARAAESAKVARWAVRFLGTVRAAQGAFEMYVGCTASATGIGAVLGGAALCLHGADSLHTGSREMWSGDPQHTQISQSVAGVATIAGADEHTAAIIGDYGDAAVGMLGAWSVMRTAPLRYQEPTMTPSSQPRQLGDTGAKYRGGAGPELGSSETTVIGKTSGRPFNLDASGGSIRNLQPSA